jgi:hypothetical protein
MRKRITIVKIPWRKRHGLNIAADLQGYFPYQFFIFQTIPYEALRHKCNVYVAPLAIGSPSITAKIDMPYSRGYCYLEAR